MEALEWKVMACKADIESEFGAEALTDPSRRKNIADPQPRQLVSHNNTPLHSLGRIVDRDGSLRVEMTDVGCA